MKNYPYIYTIKRGAYEDQIVKQIICTYILEWEAKIMQWMHGILSQNKYYICRLFFKSRYSYDGYQEKLNIIPVIWINRIVQK